MSQSELLTEVATQLLPETALATRIIRSKHAPRELLLWLSAPAAQEICAEQNFDREIAALLNQLISPLLEFASHRERKQAQYAEQYLSVICREVSLAALAHGLTKGPQLLATGLLPLYRCLATREFGHCFEQARHRLLESLSILALCYEVGEELSELLDDSLCKTHSPHALFDEHLRFNIVSTGFLIRNHVLDFVAADEEFSDDAYHTLKQVDSEQLNNQRKRIPDWADPDLLWRLAGEINTDEPNLVLPRSWIEANVPWQSTLQHWRELTDLLADYRPHNNSLAISNTCVSNSSDQSSNHEVLTTGKITMKDAADSPLTKVLIAEILSHNDPAFVNLIRRQLANCRADARPILLASIVVHDEHKPAHRAPKGRISIAPWQQNLVNKIADHPEIDDSFAFVTCDAQLFVCILDIERSDAAHLLRNSLTRILGTNQEGRNANSLRPSRPPLRYHAGLASASSPNPSLGPEDLIEATLRCLAAAEGGNKSSIKSIEVY